MIRWVLERKRNGRTDGRGTGTHSPSIRQHLLGNCSAILPFSSASSVFPLVPNPKIPKEKVQIDDPIACVAIDLKPSFLVKERDSSVQNVQLNCFGCHVTETCRLAESFHPNAFAVAADYGESSFSTSPSSMDVFLSSPRSCRTAYFVSGTYG